MTCGSCKRPIPQLSPETIDDPEVWQTSIFKGDEEIAYHWDCYEALFDGRQARLAL